MKKFLQWFLFTGSVFYVQGCATNSSVPKNTDIKISSQKFDDAKYINGLIWQDMRENLRDEKSIGDAEDYCNNLNLLGTNGWRLPSTLDVISLENNVEKLHYVSKYKRYHTSSPTCKTNPIYGILGTTKAIINSLETGHIGNCQYSIGASNKIDLSKARRYSALVRCVLAPDDYKKSLVKKQKVATTSRNEQSYSGYLKAFEVSKEINDIKMAYKMADSMPKKIIAELVMARTIPDKIFKISTGGTGKANISTHKVDLFSISGGSLTGKDFVKEFIVSSSYLEIGNYEVTVEFILDLHYEYTYLGFPKSEDVTKKITKVFSLNGANNYRNKKTISFNGVITNVKSGAFGIKTFDGGLKKASISYKIRKVE